MRNTIPTKDQITNIAVEAFVEHCLSAILSRWRSSDIRPCDISLQQVGDEILRPAIKRLRQEGIRYQIKRKRYQTPRTLMVWKVCDKKTVSPSNELLSRIIESLVSNAREFSLKPVLMPIGDTPAVVIKKARARLKAKGWQCSLKRNPLRMLVIQPS